MKCAIVYSSQSGNTRYLAEALKQHLKEADCFICETGNAADIDADLFFIGFWTLHGECDNDTERFLKSLSGKTVFLFGTAGFGASPAYCRKILRRTQKHLNASVKLAGSFMCQGRMAAAVRKKYEKMLDSFFYRIYAKYMISNYDRALDHPNRQDLNLFLAQVKNVLRDSDLCHVDGQK